MAESLNCVVYLLMKKPQELDGCPTSGAHFSVSANTCMTSLPLSGASPLPHWIAIVWQKSVRHAHAAQAAAQLIRDQLSLMRRENFRQRTAQVFHPGLDLRIQVLTRRVNGVQV